MDSDAPSIYPPVHLCDLTHTIYRLRCVIRSSADEERRVVVLTRTFEVSSIIPHSRASSSSSSSTSTSSIVIPDSRAGTKGHHPVAASGSSARHSIGGEIRSGVRHAIDACYGRSRHPIRPSRHQSPSIQSHCLAKPLPSPLLDVLHLPKPIVSRSVFLLFRLAKAFTVVGFALIPFEALSKFEGCYV